MRYVNKGNKATKLGFGEGVLAAAQKDERVVGLGADIFTIMTGKIKLQQDVTEG